MNDVTFEAPGKGPWELESTHYTRPITRFAGPAILEAFPKGFAEGTARYGLLLTHLEPGLVNGFVYNQPRPYLAPPGAMKPPPTPVLWLLTRLHPKMRARIATSVRAFETKQWRADLERWDSIDKPAAIQKHLAIQLVDVTALTDDDLAAHLETCFAHATSMIELHHIYTATSVVVTGHLLADGVEWTGASPGELCGLLRGSSPISNGFAAEELIKAGEALAADEDALVLLRSPGDPAAKLEALSRHSDVGSAVSAYVAAVRYRSVGYDVGDPNAGEMPDLLVETLLNAASHQKPRTALVDAETRLREAVPPEHRQQFDELLTEARLINRMRDERGVYSDGWGTGLARRAILEVGRRLAARGLLQDPHHAPDLTLDELVSLLLNGTGPTPEEAAAHHLWRTTKTTEDAPPFLTALPPPPPPVDVLPPAARPAARAMNAALMNLFDVSTAENSDTVLRGLSVNAGTYEGVARLVSDASGFARIKQGDVLVTRSTSPYFNVVLPLLGAIVTDRGGQLSHAAIVAREYGIPGVVGTREATARIPDGARVRVDGTNGEVHVLP